MAAFNLAGLREDSEAAEQAYQQAIDSDHADWAPEAASGLGQLREAECDPEGAERAYQLAIDSGHAA
jgi:predicted negative regulator of RcsB-dependent stress response